MYFGWKSAGRCISLEAEVVVLIVNARGLHRKNAAVFRLTENSFEAACRIIINDKCCLAAINHHMVQLGIYPRLIFGLEH